MVIVHFDWRDWLRRYEALKFSFEIIFFFGGRILDLSEIKADHEY